MQRCTAWQRPAPTGPHMPAPPPHPMLFSFTMASVLAAAPLVCVPVVAQASQARPQAAKPLAVRPSKVSPHAARRKLRLLTTAHK